MRLKKRHHTICLQFPTSHKKTFFHSKLPFFIQFQVKKWEDLRPVVKEVWPDGLESAKDARYRRRTEYVVQRYVERPMLWKGLFKFHFRVRFLMQLRLLAPPVSLGESECVQPPKRAVTWRDTNPASDQDKLAVAREVDRHAIRAIEEYMYRWQGQ